MRRGVRVASPLSVRASKTAASPLGANVSTKLKLRWARSLVLCGLMPFAILTLAACATKPEIAIQSYCEIKATELIDMRDRGIRGLNEANKKAVLAGDDNWIRECKLGDRANSGGPR